MNNSGFYERLEDGFTTPEGDLQSADYNTPSTSNLEELLRDYNYTKKQAKRTKGTNQQAWITIRDAARIRWQNAFNAPEHANEVKEIRELAKIHGTD